MGYESNSEIVQEQRLGTLLTQAGLAVSVTLSANILGMPHAAADAPDQAAPREVPTDPQIGPQTHTDRNPEDFPTPVSDDKKQKTVITDYFLKVLQDIKERETPRALIPLPLNSQTPAPPKPAPPEVNPPPALQQPLLPPAPPVHVVDNDPSFTFPVITTQQALKDRPVDDRWCYASTANCHHDYNAADIMVPPGTQVVSPVDGTVVHVSDDGVGKFGSNVTIRSLVDQSIFYLTHLEDNSVSVDVGQTINQGTPIGAVGTENDAGGTSPHAHIDNLPPEYDYRVQCSGDACKPYPFRPIQEKLVQAFLMLPESEGGPTSLPQQIPEPLLAPPPPSPEPEQADDGKPRIRALIPLPGPEWRPKDTQPNVIPASIPLPPEKIETLDQPTAPEQLAPVHLSHAQVEIIQSLGLSPQRQQFVSDLLIAALNMRAKGITVNPEAMVAQAVVESGWGESGLSANYNNFFGMKAREGTPPEHFVTLPTTEYRPDGSTYRIDANFLRFNSVQAGLEGYVEFIRARDWFSDALQHPTNPSAYIDALMNGEKRWATDPAYKKTLMNMVNNLRLPEIVSAS